jgi:hypothetical protein
MAAVGRTGLYIGSGSANWKKSFPKNPIAIKKMIIKNILQRREIFFGWSAINITARTKIQITATARTAIWLAFIAVLLFLGANLTVAFSGLFCQ